mgnify:CR=1 FL=1
MIVAQDTAIGKMVVARVGRVFSLSVTYYEEVRDAENGIS